jgi:hypothetical protein
LVVGVVERLLLVERGALKRIVRTKGTHARQDARGTEINRHFTGGRKGGEGGGWI